MSQRVEQSDRTINKLKEAFGGDRPDEVSAPEAHLRTLEAELDAALQRAYTDQRAPRTAALEVQLAQERYENAKRLYALEQKFDGANAKLGQVSHPEYVADQKAYDDLTTFVDRSLKQLYGDDPQLATVRSHQTKAISLQLVDEIKRFQAQDPKGWQEMRRDPNTLAQWTNNIIKQNIPPQARKIIEQEQLKNYEFSADELYQAHREAQKMPPSKERDRIMTNIRRDIMSAKFNPKRTRR